MLISIHKPMYFLFPIFNISKIAFIELLLFVLLNLQGLEEELAQIPYDDHKNRLLWSEE